jgi:hypothetical protein
MHRSTRSIRAPHAALLVLLAALAALGAGAGVAAADEFPVCGDNVCDPFAENNSSCPVDCPVCGDGICALDESSGSCPADCAIRKSLASPLKRPNCLNDDDRDCLDNFLEMDLAWLFAPHYFYDEDESCAGAWYTSNPNEQHFGRQDFFQVRPEKDENPFQWQADATRKRVNLTYFLLHPHDCRSDGGFAGHLGDSEHVVFHLESTDLVTWTLISATFHHHGRTHSFSGKYMKSRADEIGSDFPSVAGDENSHGSFPGLRGSSSACAGTADDFCATTCDCFRGTMAEAKAANFREWVTAARNVGGPPPELWRPDTVTVTTGSPPEAYTSFDVGHGLNVEYWTPRGDKFHSFCGWECPSANRDSDGNCTLLVHQRRSCPSPLSEKVDDTPFVPPPFVFPLPPPAHQIEVTEWLRDGISVLVVGLPHLPAPEIETWLGRVAAAEDPVAELAPLVAGRSREHQLETLRWVLAGAEEKWDSALARGLLPPDRLHWAEEIVPKAGELLGGLIALLEEAPAARGEK